MRTPLTRLKNVSYLECAWCARVNPTGWGCDGCFSPTVVCLVTILGLGGSSVLVSVGVSAGSVAVVAGAVIVVVFVGAVICDVSFSIACGCLGSSMISMSLFSNLISKSVDFSVSDLSVVVVSSSSLSSCNG